MEWTKRERRTPWDLKKEERDKKREGKKEREEKKRGKSPSTSPRSISKKHKVIFRSWTIDSEYTLSGTIGSDPTRQLMGKRFGGLKPIRRWASQPIKVWELGWPFKLFCFFFLWFTAQRICRMGITWRNRGGNAKWFAFFHKGTWKKKRLTVGLYALNSSATLKVSQWH